MKNIIFGYARVSSKDQNEKRQIEHLRSEGVLEKHIVIDKDSGKDFNRKEYQKLVQDRLCEGDKLIICSIDRLGRNYSEIMEQWRYITQLLKVDIKVLDMPLLDTTRTQETLENQFIADLVLQILSYVADKERENIRRRQRQGLEVMKVIDGKRVSSKTNRPIGRPRAEFPENWDSIYTKWDSGEITAKSAMEQLDLKINTFYKLSKQYKQRNK